MSFYTYILYSNKLDRYYIGSCEDLVSRLKRHNEKSTKSTKCGIPRIIVYSENYLTRAETMARESDIKKKKSRKYIEYLIAHKNGSSAPMHIGEVEHSNHSLATNN